MAQKRNEGNDEPGAEQLPVEDEKRLEHPLAAAKARPKVTPLEEGTTTRVLLTGDNRTVVTEAYVPTDEFGFRIKVNDQWFEHVGEAADSGTWIFAPTR